jgi:preprotein translocase subunit SecA
MHKQEAQIVEEAGKPVWLPLQLIWRVVEQILSAEVKAAGGLAIVGTERHDSRRVDRQLRSCWSSRRPRKFTILCFS